ncbi:MAG: hypothetical protein ACD_2C00172G0002 [uncultured bacterium (gcode 4)]|uniref:Uncharacterized protein n=1 Tax=uncultured bacterium (gcode 4) TaxID=1234023 RepID=K2GGB8_9BACT|nr:MAG: hypothetical protein ACD_2C00172G0002 [uncultured bacterium (gcode 4)]
MDLIFCRNYNIPHHLNTLDRVFSHSGLSWKHQAIGLLHHRIEYIRDLSPCREWTFYHRLKKVGRNNYEFTDFKALGNHLSLVNRQRLNGNLYSQISSRDHDSIGNFDYLI